MVVYGVLLLYPVYVFFILSWTLGGWASYLMIDIVYGGRVCVECGFVPFKLYVWGFLSNLGVNVRRVSYFGTKHGILKPGYL